MLSEEYLSAKAEEIRKSILTKVDLLVFRACKGEWDAVEVVKAVIALAPELFRLDGIEYAMCDDE